MALEPATLLRRALGLEYLTLAWNIAGVAVLAIAAVAAGSVALAGFGIDSLIEIGASVVVVWELTDTEQQRRHQALRLIGLAFLGLALYLLVQGTVVLASGHRASQSQLGLVWTAVTALVMLALAWGKWRIGRALGNPALAAEGRVTLVDGILAASVFAGLALDAALGWWWADPVAGFVLVGYAVIECRQIFSRQDPS